MKKLLTKFRLSNALDEQASGPIPDALRKNISACPDLRDFAQRAAELDLALRCPPGVPPANDTLHHSIMRAIRATTPAPAPTRVPLGIGLATALGALAVIGILLVVHSRTEDLGTGPSEAQTKAAAQIVKNIGELSRTMPLAVVAPLSNEWASVDQDVRDTTRFIMASLP